MNIEKLALELEKAGGKCYLIGGAVIDSFFDRPIKDYDIEVYGISISKLQSILESLNLPCNMVGQSFGVIKTQLEEGEIDLSIPRRENKVGVKHTDFNISLDPHMSPKEAGIRRDLTINSMYQDILTGEIVDPFNGLEDLVKGRIRATNPDTFIEDPLRVLRIMQLLPRKGQYVDPKTIKLCESIKSKSTIHRIRLSKRLWMDRTLSRIKQSYWMSSES
jgi:tRNA nucleotidyltransferase (CCA-adding enzyme)